MSHKINYFDLIDFKETNQSSTINVANLFSKVWRRRLWFIVSIISAYILGEFYIQSTQETYSRTATILIKGSKRGTSLGEVVPFQDIFSLNTNSINDEVGIITSRRMMMKVVQGLNLETNYQIKNRLKFNDLYNTSPINIEYIDDIAKNSTFICEVMISRDSSIFIKMNEEEDEGVLGKKIEAHLNEVITTPYGIVKITPTIYMTDYYYENAITISKVDSKELAKAYVSELNVKEVDKSSSLVSISIVDVHAKRAEDILNTLINVYKTSMVEDENYILTNTLNFIKEKAKVLENALQLIDSDIEDYKRKNKLTDIFSVGSMYLQNYSKLDTEVLDIENQLGMAKYMKEYMCDNSKQEELIPINIGINSSGIESQVSTYNELMTRRNNLIINSSENNPVVVELNSTLVSIRASIINSIENLIASLDIKLNKYDSEKNKSSSKIANVSTQQKYIINIERQLKIKEELYLYLLKKQEEIEIQLTTIKSNCSIIDTADGPIHPISPNRIQFILICLMLGGIIPIIVMCIHSLFNTRVYTKKEIVDFVDIPFIGELPYIKNKKNIVIEDGSRNLINESFRLLRDNIKMTNSLDTGNVILITSFNPNAGKTFITSNLATAFALTKAKVILLDIDLRKATFTKRLGFNNKQLGLSTYLNGRVDNVEDIIFRYKDSNLDVIPSGILPPNPAELLDNGRLAILIKKLKEEYDYILIDSVPYGIVSDTAICIKYADITIMTVRSGVFSKNQLPYLADIYKSKKITNMLVVLNYVSMNNLVNGYGYDCNYGYGETIKKNLRYYIKVIFGI